MVKIIEKVKTGTLLTVIEVSKYKILFPVTTFSDSDHNNKIRKYLYIIFWIKKEGSKFGFFAGINYKLKLMQKTHLHPIYYYRFSFDTDEAFHKIIQNNTLKGNIPLVFYLIAVLKNLSYISFIICDVRWRKGVSLE